MDVNRATELITGVPRIDLVGSDFTQYFTEPDKAREGYQKIFMKGSVRDYPLSIRHTAGMVTDVLYNATVYKNEKGEVQGVFAAARDITERKRAEEKLRESEQLLRSLSFQLMTAQENERKRLSRELHDGLGQSLTAIKFKVETYLLEARKNLKKPPTQPLETVIPVIQESVREIRRIQTNLHPPILDDFGILATLEWLCREFGATYPKIRLEKQWLIQEDEVPDSIKMPIYRILQEALNNISKHSQADLVHLSLQKARNAIELKIQDNGQGFDMKPLFSEDRGTSGIGLASMRERTEQTGGDFTIESGRTQGTMIRISWPLS